MSYPTEIALLLMVIALACAIPGVFLVLRRMSLVTDAISHVLLLGIVLAYFVIGDLESPWLLVGAAATGLVTVFAVEWLRGTKLVSEDAAIGLIFPFLFACGVFLASIYLRSTHLDVDRVLLGQPEFATDPRWRIGDLAIKPIWVLVVVALINALFVALFYKQLKLTTFDPGLATTLGYSPARTHYALMSLVCLTAVTAFDCVGPVLVVGFFVVPAASALLLTDRLMVLIVLAAVIGAAGGWFGTGQALRWETNIAGSVAVTLGFVFALAFIFAPSRGLLAQFILRSRQRRSFHETVLAIHLYQHQGTESEADEARIEGLHRHLDWPPEATARVIHRAERYGLVQRVGPLLQLTAAGRIRAETTWQR